ncbi:putative metal-binding membrane protein [Nitrobacteraceae bacterium AZCC 2161]
MTETSALAKVLRHDRLIAAVGLAGVVGLAWVYIVAGAGIDMSMAGMPMEPMPWSPFYAALVFTMWWVMMIAMMVPSATPMVLLFTTIKCKQGASVRPSVEAWIFLGGYLLIWAGFSFVAALAQWGLERVGLLSMAMASASTVLGGVVLIAAGLYQFTPIKSACLRYCQSPVLFLSQHWRPGAVGALLMGLRHGSYCLGCCWFLMALLFVSGVMNLVWIAGIALYVAFEKLLPLGHRLSRATGVALVVWGTVVLARAT